MIPMIILTAASCFVIWYGGNLLIDKSAELVAKRDAKIDDLLDENHELYEELESTKTELHLLQQQMRDAGKLR